MTIQYHIAENKFYFDKLWKFDIKDDKICNWIKAHAFSLCPLANWKLFRLWFDSLFFQHKSSVKKNQTTSTFSLKPLVGATLALKALLNCRSSLPFASDDVITYTPLPGRWYPHSLKKSGENIKEYKCHAQATLTEKTDRSPDPGLSNQVVSDLHPMVAEAPLLVEGHVKFQNRHL